MMNDDLRLAREISDARDQIVANLAVTERALKRCSLWFLILGLAGFGAGFVVGLLV